eukprot:scaffold27456_cov32-Tisochrysis_lutea.AAC.5
MAMFIPFGARRPPSLSLPCLASSLSRRPTRPANTRSWSTCGRRAAWALTSGRRSHSRCVAKVSAMPEDTDWGGGHRPGSLWWGATSRATLVRTLAGNGIVFLRASWLSGLVQVLPAIFVKKAPTTKTSDAGEIGEDEEPPPLEGDEPPPLMAAA